MPAVSSGGAGLWAGVRLGRWFGTAITLSPSTLLLAILCVVAGLAEEVGVWLTALAAHEIAHLAVVAGLGHHIDRVDIQPFGGVASGLGPLSLDAPGEATVALAGPFGNLLLMALVLAFSRWIGADAAMLRLLVDFNLAMALFNLLPALPLDGGRATRGFLAQRLGYRHATRWVAGVGRAVAGLLLVVTGVALGMGQVWATLPVIAACVWAASGRELREMGFDTVRQSLWRSRQLGRRPRKVEHLVVEGTTTVDEALRVLLPGRFYVFDVRGAERKLVGSVNENGVLDAYWRGHGSQSLSWLLQRTPP